MHQRNAVAALCLVHEVGRKEDGDAIVAGKVDQATPKGVARDRVHARGWLVENEEGWPVEHRHGELQPLLNSERQALWLRVCYIVEIVALEQFLDPAFDLSCRQMVETRMQIEILPDGELTVEGKRLRHIADVAPRLHVVGAHGPPEQLR